jgi:predicted Rossmann fold nucleotide-binding protein DprA/Smf involved in DNA uptake
LLRRDLERDWVGVLGALYLPGSPHGLHLDRRRWFAVLGALRSLGASLSEAQVLLKSKGFFTESAALESRGVLAWAEVQVAAGRVFTCFDPSYPERWLAVLGDQAPPAAWRSAGDGQLSASLNKSIGIVGSRRIEPAVHRFCAEVAREAGDLGYRVVSGGAMGCDRAALDAAARAEGKSLLLLPYGLDLFEGEIPTGQTVVSLSDLSEPFSTGRAMERNALIYAAGSACVVGQVGFRAGGTWHGAVGALRRGLTRILVRKCGAGEMVEAIRGARALVALGASYLEDSGELSNSLGEIPQNWGLFSALKAG